MKNVVDIGKVLPVQPQKPGLAGSSQKASQGNFSELLHGELRKNSEVRFSAHAQQRLASRHIELTSEDRSSLAQAVDRAAGKGSRDSLVLLRDMAFVVSVKNRTVVTALDGETLQDSVFTNIDSAVIVK